MGQDDNPGRQLGFAEPAVVFEGPTRTARSVTEAWVALLARVAGVAAPVAAVRLRVRLFGFADGVLAVRVPAELMPVRMVRRMATALGMDLVVAIGLLVRVDVVVGHDVLHPLR